MKRGLLILVLAGLIALGFAARITLSWYSIGSNDAQTWPKFAALIEVGGLLQVYDRSAVMNHPPLAALSWVALLRLSEATGIAFEFLYRIPTILADAASCALLAVIWSARRNQLWGWLAATAFAWNLDAILVSAYHCNSDSLYAFFSLLAAHLAVRRRMLWSGLALAGGINVKIVPVLLIPPLLSACRTRRELFHFLLGTALGALPFLPVLLNAAPQFSRNVLAYNSHPDRWGIGELLFELHRVPALQQSAYDSMQHYNRNGRYLVFGCIALLSAWSLLSRRLNALELGALTYAIFLILAPGFGVQYTIMIAPLLLALSIPWGSVYGLLAGVFLLLVYWSNWTGEVPFYSRFDGPLPTVGAIVGIAVWALLVAFATCTLCRRAARAVSCGGADATRPSR